MDKVPSGVWIKDTHLNSQEHPDFKQLVMSGGGVENCSLGIGYWVFLPGSEIKGNNALGIDHDGEVIYSCDSPEHSATMILPAGVKNEVQIDVYWGEQYIYSDYGAKTILHNGGYQLIYPGAVARVDISILNMGESNILGSVAPEAQVGVLASGCSGSKKKAALKGCLT